jgi:site-specific recombinase XerD
MLPRSTAAPFQELKADMNKSPFDLLNEYLSANPREWDWENKGSHAKYIKTFLRWMENNNVRLETLDRRFINKFILHQVDQKQHHETRYHTRSSLFLFFEWLHKNDVGICAPKVLFPHRKPRSNFIDVKLPEHAIEFVDLVRTRVKPVTQSTYRTAVKHFHRFLSENRIELQQVDRKVMEKFFKYLVERSQAPNTRIAILNLVRLYLMWLREREIITFDTQKLITWQDMPKRPHLLPRPIPPKFDRLIQQRLSKSNDLYHQGLLLMRWTGIRIGELANLGFHCLKTTHDGHKFLRVPLGKLNTERLVPLNEKTVKLLKEIQERTANLTAKAPTHLLMTASGKQSKTHLLMNAFKEMVEDLDCGDPIVRIPGKPATDSGGWRPGIVA